MPNLPRVLVENGCYHLMARGNQKQRIFRDETDFKEYLNRLKHYKRKFKFKLYGYCLMPNHIHLVGQVTNVKDLSKFMQGFALSYTAYFNDKYNGVGHLWQGRFKNKVIVKDQYLLDCISYVELNPLRAKMVNAAYEYAWSSYRERVLGNGFKLLDELTF
ncbi:MAG: transposase [Candidatus Omnitrophica bacterium]|nr:transposase [Candidatus Omnitrophota bacterium]